MCTSVTHTDTLRDTVYWVVNERSDLIRDITNLVKMFLFFVSTSSESNP